MRVTVAVPQSNLLCAFLKYMNVLSLKKEIPCLQRVKEIKGKMNRNGMCLTVLMLTTYFFFFKADVTACHRFCFMFAKMERSQYVYNKCHPTMLSKYIVLYSHFLYWRGMDAISLITSKRSDFYSF